MTKYSVTGRTRAILNIRRYIFREKKNKRKLYSKRISVKLRCAKAFSPKFHNRRRIYRRVYIYEERKRQSKRHIRQITRRRECVGYISITSSEKQHVFTPRLFTRYFPTLDTVASRIVYIQTYTNRSSDNKSAARKK